MTASDPGARTQVWLVPLGTVERGADLGAAPSLLDDDERARAARFHRDADRARFVAAHAGLRIVLGDALGRRPADVRFARAACPLCGEEHGRPVVVDGDGLELSLSHTAGAVALALSRRTVGVDVEALDRGLDPAELEGFLHPDERRALHRLPVPDRTAAVLRGWVRKEAYLKGIGTGLGLDPTTVAAGLDERPAGTAHPGPEGWWLADLDAGPAHVAAVAVAPGGADGADPPAVETVVVPVAELLGPSRRPGAATPR